MLATKEKSAPQSEKPRLGQNFFSGGFYRGESLLNPDRHWGKAVFRWEVASAVTIAPNSNNIDENADVTDNKTKNEDREQSTVNLKPIPSGGVDPQYTYDLNGNRTSMITPFGTWTYLYDQRSRLTSITNPNNEITSFSYDALGRRTSLNYANGVVTTYTYDVANRLIGMSTDKGVTNISSFSYIYDNVGNRISMTDNDGVHNYTYDNLYRLTNAVHPQAFNPTESFTYDAAGNRLSSQISASYSYDNLNRLLEDDQFTYSYDNNGNLLSKTDKVSAAITTYQYDAENRLIQVITSTDVVQYQYDGFGRRISKTLNGVATKYVYDREDILFELNGNDQIKAIYTHGLGVDESISVDRDTNGDGTLDTTYYYHLDGLNSVRAMTDSLGNVVQSYVYNSFGNIVNQTGSVENSITYTGRELDQEVGLYFYRSRYYSSFTGRFISEDPVKFRGGINFYPYVTNNPVNFTDPSGLYVSGIGIGASGALAGTVSPGVSGTASCMFVWDDEGNKGVVCCGGFGIAGGTGGVAGLQVANLPGYDKVCDLAGSGIDFGVSSGGGAGPGLDVSANTKGVTTISGVGIGGYGAAENILSGCKLIWCKGPCCCN